jgi:ATP-dependent Clp protease ATP-binding subunit ClpC
LQKYVEDPLSEALIQGSLPRPAELEVFLSETGLFAREVKQPEEQPVGVAEGGGTAEPAAPTPLYTF